MPFRRASVTGLLLAISIFGPAVAAPRALSIDDVLNDPSRLGLAAPNFGPGWIGYRATYPLRRVRTRLVQGKQLKSGGCGFDYRTRATPALPTEQLRERAFHRRSCTTLVEVGRLPPQLELHATTATCPACYTALIFNLTLGDHDDGPEETPPDLEGLLEDPAGEPFIEPDAGAGADVGDIDPGIIPVPPCTNCRAAGVRQKMGYQYGILEDPVNINVTEVYTYIDWRYDPYGCVKSRYSAVRDNWYEPSGWQRAAFRPNGGMRCAWAHTSSYARYVNGVFCPIGGPFRRATRSIYDRIHIKGFSNYPGTLIGRAHHTKKGGCSSLLSFKTGTTRGQLPD